MSFLFDKLGVRLAKVTSAALYNVAAKTADKSRNCGNIKLSGGSGGLPLHAYSTVTAQFTAGFLQIAVP